VSGSAAGRAGRSRPSRIRRSHRLGSTACRLGPADDTIVTVRAHPDSSDTYRLLHRLSDGQAFLAVDAGGRPVTIKRIFGIGVTLEQLRSALVTYQRAVSSHLGPLEHVLRTLTLHFGRHTRTGSRGTSFRSRPSRATQTLIDISSPRSSPVRICMPACVALGPCQRLLRCASPDRQQTRLLHSISPVRYTVMSSRRI
jgi:hypothetical protein